MKAKSGFSLRDVCGEKVIIAEGIENIDFSRMISLNESAAYLWENIAERETFSISDLVSLILSQYEVDAETAEADARALVEAWKKQGIIED